MNAKIQTDTLQTRSFMSRLARDKAGNTLAIMAAFTVPLIILAGSGLDIARQYMVRTRLQQACDAGVLAGRKYMTATSGTALDASGNNAATQAQAFFRNNMQSGWMGSSAVAFSPTRTSDNQVTATATATVPMTITRIFNTSSMVVNVACTARFDIGDTDVMFVLDTTGSMADATSGCTSSGSVSYTKPDGTTGYKNVECANSKISGLRSAVLSFYDTLTANSSAATHIRYGFVTYTSTVNAGYALPSNYLVDSWHYQSRQVIGDANNGSSTNSTLNASSSPAVTSSSACAAQAGRTPATGYTTSGTATVKTTSWSSPNCTVTSQPVKPNWRYISTTYDTSQYKTGASVDDPSKITAATSKWQGCIEERDTTISSSFNQDSLPYDLDPDLVPTNDATKWRPMWPDVEYFRGNNTTSVDYSGNGSSPYGDSTNTGATNDYTNFGMSGNMSSGYISCGKPVQRLAQLTRTQVSNFVNATDFVAIGGTYHDTGMIWGLRLISPTGIFASDTAAWPGNNPPQRYIVFMTDGLMAPNESIYGMYGMERYDARVTGTTGTSNSNLTAYHNARFNAECDAAKARGITIYVIGFGQTLSTQLTNCASPGDAYYASDNAALSAAFNSIALDVAALRLSQ